MSSQDPPWWASSILAPALVATMFGIGSWILVTTETRTIMTDHARRLEIIETKMDTKVSQIELTALRAEIKDMDAKVSQILLLMAKGQHGEH